jgi:rhodanese-related sulfurtransferase
MKAFFRALCGLLLIPAGAPALAAEHTQDSLEIVKQRMTDEEAVLIDVREQSEWDAGHLSDAVLLPLSKLKQGADKKDLDSLSKDKICYIHCASGKRVLPAADALKKLGFDARPLKAGYQQLVEAGFSKAK